MLAKEFYIDKKAYVLSYQDDKIKITSLERDETLLHSISNVTSIAVARVEREVPAWGYTVRDDNGVYTSYVVTPNGEVVIEDAKDLVLFRRDRKIPLDDDVRPSILECYYIQDSKVFRRISTDNYEEPVLIEEMQPDDRLEDVVIEGRYMAQLKITSRRDE